MQELWDATAQAIDGLLEGDERFTASFSAEESDFVRFNGSRVRQAGNVAQRRLSLDLIHGRRHAAGSVALTGTPSIDRPRVNELVQDLRD